MQRRSARVSRGGGELAAELLEIDAVLRYLARAKKNDRNIVIVALAQCRIGFDIDLTQLCTELGQQRRDLCLGLLTEVAAGAGVERDVARSREREPAVFGAHKSVRQAGGAEPTLRDELRQQGAERGGVGMRCSPLACARDKLDERGGFDRLAAQLIKRFEHALDDWIHPDRPQPMNANPYTALGRRCRNRCSPQDAGRTGLVPGGPRMVNGEIHRDLGGPMANVVALVDDLFFQAKMQETARQVGVELKAVATGEALLAEARQSAPALLIVDLNARSGAIEALEELRAAGNQRPVVAFLSHVQVELAERANAAGCQQVMPRSKFTQNLAAILAQAKS